MEIFWSAEALEHLEHIRDHIAQENPTAALDVWDYLYAYPEQQIMPLSDHFFPQRGHEGLVPGTLELTNPRYRNYILVYIPHEDWIEIVAVRHARMEPKRRREPVANRRN